MQTEEELRVHLEDEVEPLALPFPRAKGKDTARAHSRRSLALGANSLRSAPRNERSALKLCSRQRRASSCFATRVPAVSGSRCKARATFNASLVLCATNLPAAFLLAQIDAAVDVALTQRDLVDLSFPVTHGGDALELRARFSLDDRPSVLLESGPSLDPVVLEAMGGHLEMVLGALAGGSNATLAELPLLTEAETRRALVDWNATRKPYRSDAMLHQLFEETVARCGGRNALIVGDEPITYDELNSRANRLAHRLIARGVGPESLVGILLERRLSMVVAVLAVLKSGAGYVPLDPSNPPARLGLILDDADVDPF